MTSQKKRLDVRLVELGLVVTRSQAESYIKLSKVKAGGKLVTKSGYLVADDEIITLDQDVQYVGRAALKLRSISEQFHLNFQNSNVLDVGSSTGGFTDYVLREGADKVFAVELGTDQMHPSLRSDPRIELHEKTDICDVQPFGSKTTKVSLSFIPDVVVIDLSFVSLRRILPHIKDLVNDRTKIVAMVKPQFEAQLSGLKHKGVIKNEKIRRQILKDFEQWVQAEFVILDKSDSKVSGSKGNLERFYLLNKTI
jgi:23S rRNA (cytidine1920-2'-O)/16S rRNA (cytidine1409-2'-O)-methyltransferase